VSKLITDLPDAADAPPVALLPYQQRWVADQALLKIGEKGRRIGLTWAEASDAVLSAAREDGSNYFYISATQDMAREFVEACVMWTKAFDTAASAISEGIYDDGQTSNGARQFIKTYEIVFPKSGRRITALSSRPKNLRGKQGTIGIDEAAFHDNLGELIKAALAMLMWGDKVRIWSTHDGVENAFNELIEQVRAGKRGEGATVHRITFMDAVQQGLYKRICLRKGLAWSQAAEDAWVKSVYGFYGDGAAEELDVVPSQSSGAYLPLTLIEKAMSPDTPLVRSKWDTSFAEQRPEIRRLAVEGWLREEVTPHLKALHRDRRHLFGEDFGRLHDLTVITVLEEGLDLVRRVRLVVELANCPFDQQEQIMFHIVDALPRFRGGAMDAGGNGASLAEKTAQRYGGTMIEQVKLNDPFYLQHMPHMKAALEDGTLKEIPRDELLRDDLRALQRIDGTPKLPKAKTNRKDRAGDGGPTQTRHGDFAISLFMAHYASRRETGEIDWMPAPDRRAAFEGRDSGNDDDFDSGLSKRGAW
jgi:phage FluMu gp28-like protein